MTPRRPPARMKSILIVFSLLLAVPGLAEETDLRRSAVVRAVESAGKAVVNIYTEEMVKRRDWSGDFFRDVFEPRFRKKLETTSLGSGVIIDDKGHVLTNFHVVQRGARIKVALVDRREYEAKVVGVDEDLDLALIKLQTKDRLPFVPMGESSDLMPGETVIAIGNPFGLSNTVTTGVVSATHRNINAQGRTFYDFVQTDASINPGNSGGALLNINGALIGINTAIYGGGAQGIGFAIPVNRARRIVQDLLEHGSVQQAYIGVDLGPVPEKELKKLGLPQKKGVRVMDVTKGGPAATGGLLKGDIILTVENFPIESPEEYSAKMRDYAAGNRVKMEVLRQGKRLKVEVVAGTVPLALADRIVSGQLGMVVKPSKKGGLRISSLRRGTPAYKNQMRVGDMVLQVNGTDVNSMEQFQQSILRARRKGSALLLMRRGRSIYRVTFKL